VTPIDTEENNRCAIFPYYVLLMMNPQTLECITTHLLCREKYRLILIRMSLSTKMFHLDFFIAEVCCCHAARRDYRPSFSLLF